jgi:hypothetical protein
MEIRKKYYLFGVIALVLVLGVQGFVASTANPSTGRPSLPGGVTGRLTLPTTLNTVDYALRVVRRSDNRASLTSCFGIALVTSMFHV